jgi:hypothetical protein
VSCSLHLSRSDAQKYIPAQFKAALDARGLGNRMIEMKPGEDRTF